MPNESRHPGEGAAAGNDVLGNVVPSLDPAKSQVIARFDNIPSELKAYPNWVCWKFSYRIGEKTKKTPINPSDGSYANHSEPATWGTFDQAVSAFRDHDCDGIGFVFSDNDPFAGIDLDDTGGDAWLKAKHEAIFNAFAETYAELSPSGTGLHIIVKGGVPHGRKRYQVEVYSSHRFFTFTGNVYRAAPIADHGAMLNHLWADLDANRDTSPDNGNDEPQSRSDDDVCAVARAAANGQKFADLWEGRWQLHYASQSEADMALVNMLAFYSRNRAQCFRMFRASALGQRDKAQRDDYVGQMVGKAMADLPKALNFDHLFPAPIDGLPIVVASELHGKPVTPRKWHVDQLIPAGTVTLFSGDGGTGKSLAALQLAVGTVLGRAWFGVAIKQPGGALFLTAEDDIDEVHRRLADIATADHVPLSALDRLAISSLAGLDALLAVPGSVGRVLVPTGVYEALRGYVEAHRPALVVLDTLADLFGGEEVNRAQVRQFVAMLRAVAIDFGTTVVLLAHPSVAGMKDDTGLSGSTAWNNSVRSRLYMKRENEQSDVRTIEVKKANYGGIGQQIRVKWERGVFVLLGGVASASEHRQAANHTVDELFLELLADFEAKGTYLSPQHQSPTRYAPRLMSKHPKANGTTEGGFKLAMTRLFAECRIEEGVERINRRDTTIIRAVSA